MLAITDIWLPYEMLLRNNKHKFALDMLQIRGSITSLMIINANWQWDYLAETFFSPSVLLAAPRDNNTTPIV